VTDPVHLDLRELPTLQTRRLILRAFLPQDAPEVQRLAGERAIAATTATIPHPYLDGVAEAWIAAQPELRARAESLVYAVTLLEDGRLIGAVGLGLQLAHRHAEMGYWIGRPSWGQGYCTEAAAEALRFGFETIRLHRIYAVHFVSNPASGRVMQKLGMRYEGRRRQHILKWGRFEDLDGYALLLPEYEAAQRG
jgi:RimJ/RimL family protein N-acetyltransferase